MSFFSRKKLSQSPQQKQQSQPVYPWFAHAPPLGHLPSPFPRSNLAPSTTATATGELFLFGGYAQDSSHNDLYVLSTRDFSTTILQTSGETQPTLGTWCRAHRHSPFGLGRVGEFQWQECAGL